MKKLLLFILIFISVFSLQAQEYRFGNGPEGFTIESSTASGLSLHYSVNGIRIVDIDNGEARGQEIVMQGCFGSCAEGLPNLPFQNCYIAVPQGATVSIAVKENGKRTLQDIDLLPASPVQGNTAVGLPKLHKDMNVFGKDADYPTENVTIAQATQIRGLDVVLLSVTPFRYNPVRKTLEVIHDIDIKVRFEGGNGQFGEARYLNPDWNNILRDMVINPDMLPEVDYYGMLNEAINNHEEGCEYLIITPDDDSIAAWADSLRQFRNRQGILTKVVTVTECGGNEAETIKDYIKNAYDNWAIPPAAVMLFSGIADTIISYSPVIHSEKSFGIPGFPLIFIGYDNGFTLVDYNYYSDNPYSDMNDDSIPDLALSRLPAIRYEDYRTQVSKLIEFETTPPTDSSYYDKPLITSGYEENKWFLITSQCVNGFFTNRLGRHPYNFYMLYDYTTFVKPDSIWSTGYNTAAPVNYFGPDGQNYIPRYPNALNDWRNMRDNSYFVEAFNNGSFLTLYRDHCAVDWWCCPEFHSQEIDLLTNSAPTFILSIGCNTARYRLSIMGNGYQDYPVLPTFCNHQVGAIGSIGATTVTHTLYNDMITWGIVDYIWPDFMPGLGSHNAPGFVRPSYGLVSGKLFLNQYAFMPNWWPQRVTATHNVFHYLGETYLNLCTEVPQPLVVNAPPYHANNQWEYSFMAEEGSTVCFSHNNEIIRVIKATGQLQSLTLPETPCNEQFVLTATKQNRFRFEQTVTVISALQNHWVTPAFELFPNPSNGRVNLIFNETQQRETIIEAYNQLGELMLTKCLNNIQQGETYSLDLHQLASGLYIIKLSTDTGHYSGKIFKY